MKGKPERVDRLNEAFKKEIYDIISRRLKNPLITEMFSVTGVDASRDLSHAKVYISVYSKNEEKCRVTFDAICADAGRIRKELAGAVRTRTVPELHFVRDDSMEYGEKIDKLLKSVEKGEDGENADRDR